MSFFSWMKKIWQATCSEARDRNYLNCLRVPEIRAHHPPYGRHYHRYCNIEFLKADAVWKDVRVAQ